MDKEELRSKGALMTEALQLDNKVQMVIEGIDELLPAISKLRTVLGDTPISTELEAIRLKLMIALSLV